MTPSRTTHGHSLWARVLAAVVSVAGVILTVDGVVTGQWIQVLWVVLVASSAWSWWNDTRRHPTTNRLRPRLKVAGQTVCSIGMGAAGVLVVMTQGSVLQRIGGCLLVVSAICGAVAVFYQTRPPTTPPADTAPIAAEAGCHDNDQTSP